MSPGKDAGIPHDQPNKPADNVRPTHRPNDYEAGVLDRQAGIAEIAQDDCNTVAEAMANSADENPVTASEVVRFVEGEADFQRE
jgi:hypothetical protein